MAVKHLKVGLLPDDIHAHFLQEAQVHANCQTPRVVRLLGISDAPGQYALILEYMPEGSLHDVLHKKAVALAWPQRWQIALDIGTGVAYLHGKKIFHRDIKSLNVLLDTNFRAKLSDFGQAKLKTYTQSSTTGVGNKEKDMLRWQAPETFNRKYRYESSADVYSYGMVLWELASRALPYAKESSDTVVMGYIRYGNTEDIPGDCPPAYAAAIRSTWQMAANARPSASQVTEALTAAMPSPATSAKR